MIGNLGRVQLLMAAMLLCSLSLSGAVYRSNSIGMQLEQLDEMLLHESEYVLVVEQASTLIENRTLYHQGRMVEHTIITLSAPPEKRKTVVNTTYGFDGKEIVRTRVVYDGLRPINLTKTDEYGSWLTFHTYDEGKLLAQRVVQPGGEEQLFAYYRDPRDGSLIGVRVSDPAGASSIRFFSVVEGHEIFAIGDESDFTLSRDMGEGIVIRETWVAGDAMQTALIDYDESGNLIIDRTTPDGRVRSTYGKGGLLLSERWMSGASNGMEISYSYDGQGILKTSRKVIPGPKERIVEHSHIDGAIRSSQEWENGLLVKTTTYLPQGQTVVALYAEGKPYADVTYAPDGKRVLSLIYREGR